MTDLNYLWLSKGSKKTKTQEALLTKHKQPKKPKAPIHGSTGDYQADLMFIDTYARYNGGRSVILNLIHVPSRYVYSKLVKSKPEAGQQLVELLKKVGARRLWVDAGQEFVSTGMTNAIKSAGTELIVVNKSKQGATQTLSSFSMSIVERFNKTLRSLIERWITVNDRLDYSSVLDDIVSAYNNSPHSAHKLSPAAVEKAIEDPDEHPEVIAKLEENYAASKDKAQHMQNLIKQWFPLGSYVRTMLPKVPFGKSALPKFSDTILKVVGYDIYRVLLQGNNKDIHSILYHQLTRTSIPRATKTEIKTTGVENTSSDVRKKAVALHKTTRANKKDFAPGLGHEVAALDHLGNPIYKERLTPTDAGLTSTGRQKRGVKSIYAK